MKKSKVEVSGWNLRRRRPTVLVARSDKIMLKGLRDVWALFWLRSQHNFIYLEKWN